MSIPIVLDVLIGSITFAGSLIAAGKLQGIISGKPLTFPGARILNVIVAVVALGAGVLLLISPPNLLLLIVVLVASLGFGVLMVLPIGERTHPSSSRCSMDSPGSPWRWRDSPSTVRPSSSPAPWSALPVRS